MTRVFASAFILVVWLALWGEISVVNVLSGVAVVVIVAVLFRRDEPSSHTLHPLGVIRLLAVFVWRLVSSSATVVLTVLAPSAERLRSGVVGVQLTHSSPLVAAIVSDAISLTPGTLTLDARYPADGGAPTLFIHVLGLTDPEEIRTDVHGLEALVLSAVSPSDDDRPEAAPDGPTDGSNEGVTA